MSNLFIKQDLIKRLMNQTQRSREDVIKMIIKARQEKLLKEKRSKMEKENRDNMFNQPYDPSVSWADIVDDPPFNPSIIELTQEELSDISNSIESEYNTNNKSHSSKRSNRPPPIYIPKPPVFENSNLDDIPEPDLNFKQKSVNKEVLKEKFYDILRDNKYIFVNNYLDPAKKFTILLEGYFGRDLSEYTNYINELIEKEKPEPEPEYTEEPSIITYTKKSKKSTVDSDDTIEIDKFSAKKSKTKSDSFKSIISNKKNEIKDYYNKHKTFKHFINYINGLIYLDEAESSKRYTQKDIKDIKIKDIFLNDIVINIEVFLPFLYNEFLENEKSKHDIYKILKKYSGWYTVMLMRIYKKYIDNNFDVIEKHDSHQDITIIGSAETPSSPIIPEETEQTEETEETEETETDFTKYKKDINAILKESDLDTISAKKVRKQLERDNDIDLSDNKKELDEYITMLFHEFVAKSEKKKTPKKESTKKRTSTKKRSSKKARSTKKRTSTKKRSSKKRTSTKKRSTKKRSSRSTKKRTSTKKRSSKKARSTKKRTSTKKRSSKKARSTKKRTSTKKERSSKKARSTKKRSTKKRSSKKASSKKRSTKKRSSKKASSKKARSTKKRSSKKRSSKKASSKKRSSKKASSKKRSTKKRSSKKRSTKKRSSKKASSKKRSTKRSANK